MRDDFPAAIKTLLALRVQLHCSNPDCDHITHAPSTEENKIINVGKAAHITAASPRGPRYDASVTSKQRRAISNGIWLCGICADLIDKDVKKFPVKLLHKWKRTAEQNAYVRAFTNPHSTPVISANFRLDEEGKEFLRSLGVPIEEDTETTFSQIRPAAERDIDTFINTREWPDHTIPLSLTLADTENPLDITLEGVVNGAIIADIISIISTPGTGKTTTIIQLSEAILEAGKAIPVFIPLGEWSNREEDWFDFLAKKNAFRAFQSWHFKQLAFHGRLILLLDGWNELTPEARKRANSDLKSLKRDFPQLGIVIGTRQQLLPIYGTDSSSALIRIEPLSYEQQMSLAKQSRGEEGESLVDQAWRTHGLRELISIPLYLNAFLRSTQNTGFPQTKEALLNRFIQEHENSPDKADILHEQLFDFQKEFLVELAIEANNSSSTILSNEQAHAAITRAITFLQAKGQIAHLQPVTVLDILVNTHSLMRSTSELESVSFQHQQFQEWYASFKVERLMLEASQGNADAKDQLRNEVLNWLAWEESVLFACERLSREGDTDIAAVVNTILDALTIDPMLAAEMIYRSAPDIWREVCDKVINFVTQWHKPNIVDRAVRFMIITGRPEFSEKIWPLILDRKQRHYFDVLLGAPRFRPSVLGPDVQKRLSELPDDIRGHIIAEVGYRSGYDGMDLAAQLAKSDKNSAVVAEIIKLLQYRHATVHIRDILQSASDNVLEVLVLDGFPYDFFDVSLVERFEGIRRALLEQETNPLRLMYLLMNSDIQGIDAGQRISLLIQSPDFPIDKAQALDLITRAYQPFPRKIEEALIQRLSQGLEVPHGFEEILEQCASIDDGPIVSVLFDGTTSRTAIHNALILVGPLSIGKLMDEYFTLNEKFSTEGYQISDMDRDEYRQLQDKITQSRLSSFLSAFMERATTDQPHTIQLFAELLYRYGQQQSDKPLVLEGKEKDRLIALVEQWIHILLSAPETTRYQLAELATAIKRIPHPTFVPLLHQMLEHDLSTREKARKGYIQSGCRGAAPPDIAHCFKLQYRSAFSVIGGDNVIALMKDYLFDIRFGFDAACVLLDIWIQDTPSNKEYYRPSSMPDFSGVKSLRKHIQSEQKASLIHEFSKVILEAIKFFGTVEQDDEKQQYALRIAPFSLKMSPGAAHPDVHALLNLPQPYTSKYRLLVALAISGEVLSSEMLVAATNELLQLWEKEPWRRKEQALSLIENLELFAFSEQPLTMLGFLDFVPHDTSLHLFDRLLLTLSQSPHEEALVVLLELGKRYPELQQTSEWLDAILALETEESDRALLELIYAGNIKIGQGGVGSWYLSKQLTKLTVKNPVLRNEMLQRYEKLTNSPVKHLLETVLLEVPDNDTILAVIRNMVANNQLYDGRLSQAIRKLAIGQRPDTAWPSMFEQFSVPLVDFRKKLLAMLPVNDAQSVLAKACLNEIEVLRDEYGRINDEPRHPDIESNIPEAFYLF